jgi:hypothetical protein
MLGRLLVLASSGIMRRDLRKRAARLKSVLESARDSRETPGSPSAS